MSQTGVYQYLKKVLGLVSTFKMYSKAIVMHFGKDKVPLMNKNTI